MRSVELKDLTKSFPGVAPLQNFCAHIPAGSFALLSGPSGAGKTTLLRLIAGLEVPDSGAVLLDGHPASDTRLFVPPHRRRLGMSFQDFALWPHMTVQGHLDFVLRATGAPRLERRKTIDGLLELFDLRPNAHEFPAVLSGGEQQRINLARALAPAPPLLLLDEPFAHLDATLRSRILQELLRRKQQEGVTIIAASHDQEGLESAADQVIRFQAAYR
jgi:ABC-type Fe3+/spermidine/putrescine transport system ATPase subunit